VSSANKKSSPAAASPPISSPLSPPPCIGGVSWECGGDEPAEASMQRKGHGDRERCRMCRRLPACA
jgi:hypothetical protein